MELAEMLLDLSDGVFNRTWRRLEGLTDEELLWEPAPNCWTVREGPDGTVRPDWAPYVGDAEVTSSGLLRATRTGGDAHQPPPVTNLAWRLVHLTEVYGRSSNARGLTGSAPVGDVDERPVHRTAAGALASLHDAHDRWHAVLVMLTNEQLGDPIVGHRRLAGATKAGLVMALIDEFTHHGAELGVLRDLYATVHSPDPIRTLPPNLAEVGWAGLWHAMPALIEAGADVQAESRGVTVLHLAAAAGERTVVELLLDGGADPRASQQAKSFGTTPLHWAEHFGRTEVAEVLRAHGGGPKDFTP